MKNILLLALFGFFFLGVRVCAQTDLRDTEKRKLGIGMPEQNVNYIKRLSSFSKTAASGGRITWKTGSASLLDRYICYEDSDNPIRFTILIDQDVKTLENVKLTLSVWDVDEAQGEVDVVYINGQFIGTLHGANDSWSINNYSIDPSILIGGTPANPGVNNITVELTVASWCVTVDWGAVSADGGDFNIVEFIPGVNKLTYNKAPDIHFKFSDNIDDKTVTASTVKLQYRAVGGALTDVACTYTVVNDILTIKPSSQLNDGVKYSVLIVGDKDGVKSKAGAQLTSSPSYDFATMPDLTPDGPLANEAGIFPIQVVRNAKQIRDKATVMRIYTNKWTAWADVDPSSQLETLPVKVTIRDESKNELSVQFVDAKRTDLRETQANKKAGNNSMNIFFSWPASLADGGHTAEVIIEPVDQVNVPPITFNKSTPISLRAGKTLKIVYQYLLADKWAASVPADDATRMDALMANCKVIFRDNFPVTDIEMTKADDVNLSALLASYSWPKAANFPALRAGDETPYLDTIKNYLLTSDAWKKKGAGVGFVGLIPQNFGKRSVDSGWTSETDYTGLSYTVGNGATAEDNKMIFLRDDAGVAGSGANATTVIHEFGHNFKLSTKRFDGTAHTVDVMATDGYWVNLQKNKSSDEGNTDAASLKSLMSKYIEPTLERWICNYDYNELFDNVPSASMKKEAASGLHLFIAGGYNLRNQFYVSPIWESDYTTTVYPSQGDLTLVLLNAVGTQLASYNFNSYSLRNGDGQSDTVKSFAIFVPSPSTLGTLQIKKGTTLLKEIKKSASAPLVTITSPTAGSTWRGSQTISWTGSDADNEKLLYTVRYSNDSGQTWSSLAANYDKTTLAVNTTQWLSGKNAVVRISATDGTLNFVSKDVSFIVDNGLAAGLFMPTNNSINNGVGTSVEATFNTSVVVSQVTSSVFVLKEYNSGLQVAGALKYTYASHSIKFVPTVPLKYSTKYWAKIKSGIVDEFGNRLAADVDWYFTTGADNSDLSILSADPRPSSTNTTVNGGITVVFNKDVNTATLTTASFKVTDNAAKTAVAGTVTYNASTRSAFFAPAGALKKMNDYKVSLTTDIKATDAKALLKNYDFYFVTGSDSTAGVHLAGKYTESGVDDNSDKLYDWLAIDVDVSVVEAGTYSINGKLADKNNNEIVWATLNNQSLPKGLSTVRLKFDGKIINAYKINGPYYLNDLQVYNVNNTDKSDWVSYAYTTKTYAFTDFQTSTIPVVAAFTPLDGANDVPANSTVTAVFTRAMDRTSIDSNSFYVVDRANVKVKGTIAYDSASQTSTFTPAAQLMLDSVYRVAVTTNVKDVSGTRLLKQYNWSFTTATKATASSGSLSEIYTYPNPFPHASLPQGGMFFTYMLDTGGEKVKIRVYTITGDFVKEISESSAPARKGFNQVYWNGNNEAGKSLANGTYLYILYYTDASGAEHKETGKFTVLRLN